LHATAAFWRPFAFAASASTIEGKRVRIDMTLGTGAPVTVAG
jgi:hypothetical protein